jgi:serine/threonine protein kinase
VSEELFAPKRETARDLVGGTVAGKYVVRHVLGQGGMGTVYEAEHAAIGRLVALKVLHPSRARRRDAIRRFYREARAAAAIGHPNICEVYDLGSLEDGSPFLVMEKLVGETLADRIAVEGALPFDAVLDMLAQVLSALTAAHAKRIVHRDVKPENVFLATRVGLPPAVKLLDFGISKVMAAGSGPNEDLDLTRTGMVMGTPYYMSPEQARGDRDLDPRVDIYACGVILYEALTGRRPFVAANYNALLLQILSGAPRPARDLRPALPSGFDPVIEKAMGREREQRYGSAREFEFALAALRDRHGAGPGLTAIVPAAPSSIEIPVTFAADTPGSGEHAAMQTAPYPAPAVPAPAVRAPTLAYPGHASRTAPTLDEDEDPTQVQVRSPFANEMGLMGPAVDAVPPGRPREPR